MRNSQIILEGTHVFERSGSKTIGGVSNDLIITLETLGKGALKFKSSPFSFTIGNPNKNVYNSISNNTSINVEAERVVGTFDASKTGASQSSTNDISTHRWKNLKLIPLTNHQGNQPDIINQLSATIAPLEKNASDLKPGEKGSPQQTKDIDNNESPNESLITEFISKPKPKTNLEAVENIVFSLRILSEISPLHQEKSIITALDLSIELVQQVTESINGLTHEDVLGLMVKDAESSYIDSLGFVCGFEGHGYVFTPYGLVTTINGSGTNDYSLTTWQEWISKGITPQIRRYSTTQFLIFIGDKTGSSAPGFSFDLRRYNGDIPIEKIFNKLSEAYTWITENPLELHLSNNDLATSVNDISESEEDEDDEESSDDWVSPYETTTVPVAIYDLFHNLENMCAQGEIHAYKTCLRTYFSKNFFQQLYKLLEAEDADEILGAIFEEPDDLIFEDNYVDNFTGRAIIFGELGISIIHSNGDTFDVEEEIMWYEFTQNDIQLFRYGDQNNYSYSFAIRDSTRIEATTLDFTDIDCDEKDEESHLSINEYWARCWEIINFIRSKTTIDDSEINDTNQSEDNDDEDLAEEIEDEVEELEHRNNEQIAIQNSAVHAGEAFFSLFSFTLQQCSESNPKRLFTKSEIMPSLLDELYTCTGQSGSGPYAISIENDQLAEFTSDGKLSSWSGCASLISVEGIFHMTRAEQRSYTLDGKNSFLSWNKFFNSFSAGLQIREDGPDLWFGNQDKILVIGLYCDYSTNIAQWEYFEDFVMNDLIISFNNFKKYYS